MPADRSDAACTVIIMTGTSGGAALPFGHSRHVDVGKDPDQRCPRRITGL